MTVQLLKKILPTLTLSLGSCSLPMAQAAILPDLHVHGYQSAETPEVTEMHDQWLAGATAAAKQFGCTNVAVEQQPNESIADAVKLFGLVATEGSCLVLAPVSTNTRTVRYSFARGGKVDGIDLLYISDTSTLKVWNGVSQTR
jgi:hypothetical protein